MCRWLVYSETPALLDDVLYQPAHSLIDQSLRSRMGVETTNGDGFGISWYAPGIDTPAIVRDTGPAWNNRNLREVAGLGGGVVDVGAGDRDEASVQRAHPAPGGRVIPVVG